MRYLALVIGMRVQFKRNLKLLGPKARYPEPGYNLFTVRDLLLLCEPTPVRFEENSYMIPRR